MKVLNVWTQLLLFVLSFSGNALCKPSTTSSNTTTTLVSGGGVEQSLVRDILERAFGLSKENKIKQIGKSILSKKNEVMGKPINERVREINMLQLMYIGCMADEPILKYNLAIWIWQQLILTFSKYT